MHSRSAQRRLAIAGALTGLILGVSACSSETPAALPSPSGTDAMGSAPTSATATTTTVPATPSPTSGGGSSALPAGWVLCQNELRGSSMGYPGGWFTTELRPADKCSQFHPEEFTIPAGGEFPLTALNAVQTGVTVAQYVADATNPDFVTVNARSSTTVLGMATQKFETTSTGEGLYEAGTKVYGYAINRGGRAFVVWSSARPGEARYASWKTIVDQAVSTLRFL